MATRKFAVAALAAALSFGCIRVDSGGAGVKWTWTGGTQPEVYGEGVHIIPPWNRMVVYDVRIQDRLESIKILTSNGLSVQLEVSIRFKPIIDEVARLHATIGPAYYDKILKPIVRSQIREVGGQYIPEEIYSTKRLLIGKEIFTGVESAVEGKHLTLEAILIRDVGLPDKLKRAIEDKLEEEQRAAKMTFVLERERREADRKRIEAKGIADFQKIVSAGITTHLLQWKGIEATEKLASSENAKVVVIGSGKTGLPLILGGN